MFSDVDILFTKCLLKRKHFVNKILKRKHFVNKISTSENVVVEMHTNPDERIPSFIFKQIGKLLNFPLK